MVSEYNGWPSYETWRVALELEESLRTWGEEWLDDYDGPLELLVGKASEHLQEMVYEWVQEVTEDTLARGWAYSFLGEVQWRPIVTTLLEDHPMVQKFEQEVLGKSTIDV